MGRKNKILSLEVTKHCDNVFEKISRQGDNIIPSVDNSIRSGKNRVLSLQ